MDPRIIANYWKSKDETVWTLVNLGFETVHKEVLAVPSKERVYYFDVRNNIELMPRQDNGISFLSIKLEPPHMSSTLDSNIASILPVGPAMRL